MENVSKIIPHQHSNPVDPNAAAAGGQSASPPVETQPNI